MDPGKVGLLFINTIVFYCIVRGTLFTSIFFSSRGTTEIEVITGMLNTIFGIQKANVASVLCISLAYADFKCVYILCCVFVPFLFVSIF